MKLFLVCLKKKKIDNFDFYLTMKKRTLKLAMFTVAVWYEAELFICSVWAWICFVSVNTLDWFLFFILLMLTDVTGFIVKLIMVNKCWLPARLCVLWLFTSCIAFLNTKHLETRKILIHPTIVITETLNLTLYMCLHILHTLKYKERPKRWAVTPLPSI